MALDPRIAAVQAAESDPVARLTTRIAELERRLELASRKQRGRVYAEALGIVTAAANTYVSQTDPGVDLGGPSITLTVDGPNRFLSIYAEWEARLPAGSAGAGTGYVKLNVTGEVPGVYGGQLIQLAEAGQWVKHRGGRVDVSGGGAPAARAPVLVPVVAGTYTIALRYACNDAYPHDFRNRRLWAELV